MPVTLYLSNDLNQLAKVLSQQIKTAPLGPFGSEQLVVQTEGMRRWLSIKIAENNGISAQMNYYSPDHLLKSFFHLAGLTTEEMITPPQLRWVLFDILDEPDFQTKYPSVYQYYRDDALKRMMLATTTADLFDQYTVYRPEFISAWNADKTPDLKTKDPEFILQNDWQKTLWSRSKQILKRHSKDMDKTTLSMELEKRLNDPKIQAQIRRTYPRISFFGLSTFTRFHLQLFLRKISTITQVSFYFINPAPETYWYHDISEKSAYWIKRIYHIDPASQYLYKGNPLLMNWGRTAKELMAVFFGELADEVQMVSVPPTLPSSGRSHSLLETIQMDLFNNFIPTPNSLIPSSTLQDDSINIAAHYTPYREIEGLYDYLLRQMELHGYKPHEMIVLVPNIDTYAPFIQAVFNNIKKERRIPFTITDRSYNGLDNPIGVLKALLQLREEDFTSEGIFQLLESDFIRAATEIKDLDAVRRLIQRANIRFGIAGDPELETDIVSWSHGLERLILGYAMKTDIPFAIADSEREVLPLDIMEGAQALEGLRLVGFIQRLISFIRRRKRPRRLVEWKKYTLELMSEMMHIPEAFMEEYNYILLHLEALETIDPSVTSSIDYEVFSRGFTDELFANQRRGKLITGQLTFSGMIPMRTIPYKVIAILGLNKGAFPRQPASTSFDLMQIEHTWGDRNVKEFDKYLFLETIIAAKERLYLSYIGQNIKDNSPLPPSALIDQLLEYISQRIQPVSGVSAMDTVKAHLLHRHPILHYNAKYYDASHPAFYTYLDYGHQELHQTTQTTAPIIPSRPPSIKDLKKCFTHPIAYYFNRTLGIYFNRTQLLLPESEPFEMNALANYHLKKLLLGINQEKEDLYEMVKEWKYQGLIPLKNAGWEVVQRLQSEVEPFRRAMDEILGGALPTALSISYTDENHLTLQDTLPITGNSRFIFPCISRNIARHLIAFHIQRFLIGLVGNTTIQEAHFLYKSYGKTIRQEKYPIPSPQEAKEAMAQLLKWEHISRTQILPFYPDAAKEWFKKLQKGTSSPEANKIFLKRIEEHRDNDNSYSIADAYLLSIDPQKIFAPFLENAPEQGNLLYEIAELFYN